MEVNPVYEMLNKQHDYDHQLAEDIIDQNCIDCPEFLKPLGTSCCWCGAVNELVDRELYRINECTQDREDSVALEWEIIRHMYVHGSEPQCERT